VSSRCYTVLHPIRLPILDRPVHLVGVAGFEPTAPRSQSECATKLRHTPLHRLVPSAAYATTWILRRPPLTSRAGTGSR
jgi:hypothetical protein